VHMHGGDIEFVKRDKLPTADFNDWINQEYSECHATLSLMTGADECKCIYTRKEVRHAMQAKEFINNAGYPSRNEAIHLIRDEKIIIFQ